MPALVKRGLEAWESGGGRIFGSHKKTRTPNETPNWSGKVGLRAVKKGGRIGSIQISFDLYDINQPKQL